MVLCFFFALFSRFKKVRLNPNEAIDYRRRVPHGRVRSLEEQRNTENLAKVIIAQKMDQSMYVSRFTPAQSI